jgi:2-polyprenyl-6-methoxyphenol hydroxylase-like FAD-dependent oxidoreductase
MALAIGLQKAGVSHVIVDKLQQGHNTSRAGVIHAHTLEVLERLGVSHDLVRRGLTIQDFAIRERDRVLLLASFSDLPSAYPFLLMLPQNETEAVLSARLTALGGAIHRGFEAKKLEQGSEACRVTLETPGGIEEIQARFVVGADGMHSVVREAAGIGFEGGSYAESFVLADVRMDWALSAKEVSLLFSPSGLVVVAPLPNGTYRVVATVDQAPEVPSLEFIQKLIDERGPTARRSVVTNVEWSSRFRLHHRLAQAYRKDRLLLMGDAAHVHSPAGGQGMNTGLVDSVVLGEILSQVVKGQVPETALDLYGSLRRPAAAEVLKMAGMLTEMAVMEGAAKRFLRNTALTLANALPPAKRRLKTSLSGLSRAGLSIVPPLLPLCRSPHRASQSR